MRNAFNFIVAGTLAAAAMTAAPAGADTVLYSQGFETDTASWSSATRVPSGTNGITSSDGSFHATTTMGTFTQWGGYNYGAGATPTAFQPYTTSVDVYLDPGAGFANDTRLDFTSAINNALGTHKRDFAFNVGFYNSSDATGPGANTDRFVFSASNATGRANSFPKNPARNPAAVDDAGWYTLTHEFRDNGSGTLEAELSLFDPADTLVTTWTLSDPSDLLATVGGNRYGWLPNNEFGAGTIAVDNASLTVVPEPAGMGLLALGGVMLLGRRGRRRRAAAGQA